MPDTLKGQFTAHLRKGNILMSDNGRAMASIVEYSLGWHDSISGYTDRLSTDKKYGKTTYQEERNEFYRCGRKKVLINLRRSITMCRTMQ